jgi:hypothetical protein
MKVLKDEIVRASMIQIVSEIKAGNIVLPQG